MKILPGSRNRLVVSVVDELLQPLYQFVVMETLSTGVLLNVTIGMSFLVYNQLRQAIFSLNRELDLNKIAK